MLVPLTGGAYEAIGKISNAQVCENLYPEINPQESEPDVPVTLYTRPGLGLLSQPPVAGPGRGVWVSSLGALYAVVGVNAYFIDANWKWNLLGQLTPGIMSPVSFIDNGVTGVFVDGSRNGYTLNLVSNTWSGLFIDSTSTFVGATRGDTIDGFLVFNSPGTVNWVASLLDQMAFNGLSDGSKAVYPDLLRSLICNLDQVWLIGSQTSEVWFNAGSTPFPFQKFPNVFVPYGTNSVYTLARADISVFWLARNKDGDCIVVKTDGYGVVVVSTRALEAHWKTFQRTSDAVAYTYQQGGHTYYVIHFPSADESWAYDLSTKQWHRRIWIDNNGIKHRERIAFHAQVTQEINGIQTGYPDTNVGQDWQTGQIYAMSQSIYTDNGQPIVCVRSFPHLVKELKQQTLSSVVADFETGTFPASVEGVQDNNPWSSGFSSGFGPTVNILGPRINLRVSRDGGGSYGNYRQKGFISAGNYRSMERFRGVGMGRDFVLELSWSIPMQGVLQGAYVDIIEHAA